VDVDVGDDDVVTTVFTWDVVPGREREFERWASGVNQVASRYPGHLGATWLRAQGVRNRYYTVLNFIDRQHLDDWLGSRERAEWLERLHGIAKVSKHRTTGLETWFSLPSESVPMPPRWKMVIVTFSAVYPLSLILQITVVQSSQSWPLPLRALTFPLIVVPLLTYLLMPALSRLLRRWLYRPERTQPPARPDV
jgi:antibiotic biosynthesis monooxygenase (ABM) superfamily enzyme